VKTMLQIELYEALKEREKKSRKPRRHSACGCTERTELRPFTDKIGPEGIQRTTSISVRVNPGLAKRASEVFMQRLDKWRFFGEAPA
jgi:hypothetical protein